MQITIASQPARFLAGLVVSMAALAVPTTGRALEAPQAAHLLSRTGFGPTVATAAQLAPLDSQAAVHRLLDGIRTEALTPPPAWVDEALPDLRNIRNMSEAERKQWREQTIQRSRELKSWWFREMLATDSPLTERLTLFWHNHFTSSLRKVKSPTLLYRQNVLLRRHAAGNFRTLLHAVAQDPAMIRYLDGNTSRRDKPNENFARELLELFTTGEGHYTERDIKEAARAFTGWSLEPGSGQARFNPRRHDTGNKEFMGRRGNFNGDDILDIVLDQPRVAEHITEKLWREFVSDTPEAGEVRRLATIFRANGYELRPLLEAMFTATSFWSKDNRGVLVKSPVELIVGSLRVLELPVEDTRLLAAASSRLGQDLFDPPNVKGWPGGTAWISSNTLLVRGQLLERLIRAEEMSARRARPSLQPMNASTGSKLTDIARLEPLLLPLPPVTPPAAGASDRERLRGLLLDPVYQLK
jgi:uncharacterized protein (DUF1800 family)